MTTSIYHALVTTIQQNHPNLDFHCYKESLTIIVGKRQNLLYMTITTNSIRILGPSSSCYTLSYDNPHMLDDLNKIIKDHNP